MGNNLKKRHGLQMGFAVLFAMLCIFAFRMDAKAAAPVTGVKQIAASENYVKVQWNPTNDNLAHRLEYSTDNVTWYCYNKYGTTETSDILYSLQSGKAYYARVSTLDQYHNILASSNVITVATLPSGYVSGLKDVKSTENSITLNWNKLQGASTYKIEYYNENSRNKKYTKTTSKNSITITKLAKNSAYTFRVYAGNKGFYGSSYRYISAKPTPTKVTGVRTDYFWKSTKKIVVSCKKLGEADGYQTEVYTAYKKKDTKVATQNSRSYVGESIKNSLFGKNYMFKARVRAYTYCADGKTKKYGAWSTWIPTAPQPKVTKMRFASGRLQINYEKITGASKYDIYVSTKQQSGYKKVGSTTKTSYTISKFNKKALNRKTRYYVYVVPCKKIGKSYYAARPAYSNYCWYLR